MQNVCYSHPTVAGAHEAVMAYLGVCAAVVRGERAGDDVVSGGSVFQAVDQWSCARGSDVGGVSSGTRLGFSGVVTVASVCDVDVVDTGGVGVVVEKGSEDAGRGVSGSEVEVVGSSDCCGREGVGFNGLRNDGLGTVCEDVVDRDVARKVVNCARRQKNKDRKARKRVQIDDVDKHVPEWRRGSPVKVGQVVAGVVSAEDIDGKLKESVRRKWIAKNELQALEAERRVAVLKANTVDEEVKQYRTKVHAATERNMVSIERTHARLAASDNVPRDAVDCDDAGSRVCTLVSGDVSISPNSSASQAEVRAMQKRCLDQEAEIQRLRLGYEKLRIPHECCDVLDKRTWTLENGSLPDESKVKLDALYPDGYATRGEPWCEGIPTKAHIIV